MKTLTRIELPDGSTVDKKIHDAAKAVTHPKKTVDGYCVEFITKYDGDCEGGFNLESVTYGRRYFTAFSRAQTFAGLMRCMEPCPVVAGDIAIHSATCKSGNISDPKAWRLDDERNTTWLCLKDGIWY